jgi:hypothetical protein
LHGVQDIRRFVRDRDFGAVYDRSQDAVCGKDPEPALFRARVVGQVGGVGCAFDPACYQVLLIFIEKFLFVIA